MKIIKLVTLVLSILAYQNWSAQIYIADTNVCGNTQVLFKDINPVPAGKAVVNRYWDFDGVNKDTTTEDSVFFAFANTVAGSQLTVNLTIVYDDASTANFTRIVRVWALPIIDSFKVNRLITCPSVDLRFETYSSFDPVNGAFLTNWSVEFGDLNAVNPTTAVDNNIIYSYGAMGVYKAVYAVRDNKNCISKTNLEIRIIQKPEVKFTPIQPRCRDSLVLYENRTIGKDSTWIWSWNIIDSEYVKGVLIPDSFVKSNPIKREGLNVFTNGYSHIHPWYARYSPSQVFLWGENKYGCRDTSDLFITNVDTTPTLVFTPRADTTICFGESVQYLTRGSDTIWYGNFQWGNKISGDSIVLFTPRNTTTYTVFGKTPQCPPTSKNIKITVVQPVETGFDVLPRSASILRGKQASIVLTKNGILDSLKWSPDSSLSRPRNDSTGAAPPESTMYKVKIYYSLGNYTCTQEDSVKINVNTECRVDSLRIPNAFSPNSDTKNDFFYLKSSEIKTILKFDIYNRWGNNIFNVSNVPANDKEYHWNGKMNNSGDDLPPGVYIYNISAVCHNDQILNFQGEVTLFR